MKTSTINSIQTVATFACLFSIGAAVVNPAWLLVTVAAVAVAVLVR